MEKPLAWFTELSRWIAEAAGHPITFIIALLTIIVWAATGPLFDYTDAWQLVTNRSHFRHCSDGVFHSENP